MSESTTIAIAALTGDVILHPRIAQQNLFAAARDRGRLVADVPPLLPFRRPYHSAVAILDWDHRLPSRQLFLRLYLFTSESSRARGEAALEERRVDIESRDIFPEFDVPDFEGLPADEAYAVELEPTGRLGACRFTAPWRRFVDETDGSLAVTTARSSIEFARLDRSEAARSPFLGDLEAVAWIPPCESGHRRWTVDVWYLLAFDGRTGTGRSFLVDPIDRRVVVVRDFSAQSS